MITVDLVSANHVVIYQYILEFALIISTILCLLTLYIVSRVSTKSMGAYQYIICAEVISSYGFDIVITLMQPVTIFPHHCFYLAGPLGYFEFTTTRMIFKVLGCFTILKGYCLLVALFYRYVMSLPPYANAMQQMIRWNKWVNCGIGFTGLAFGTAVTVLTMTLAEIPQTEIEADIKAQSPSLSFVFMNEPSLICYSLFDDRYGGSILPLYVCFLFLGSGFILLILILGMLTFHNTNTIRSFVSSNSHKNHRMLLLAWVAQVTSLTTFDLLPIVLGYCTVFFSFKAMNYIILMSFTMCALHSICDCFILLTIVKPYRVFVRKSFHRLRFVSYKAEPSSRTVFISSPLTLGVSRSSRVVTTSA